MNTLKKLLENAGIANESDEYIKGELTINAISRDTGEDISSVNSEKGSMAHIMERFVFLIEIGTKQFINSNFEIQSIAIRFDHDFNL